MRIFAMDGALEKADDVRGLTKSASGMPLSQAVKDLAPLANASGIGWALCGGLAVGVHGRPRGTDDVDVVVSSDSEVEQFMLKASAKFRRTRGHAMVHKATGVEVEIVTPEFVRIDPAVASKAISTATQSTVGGVPIPVVTREALVAMKLCRGSDYDRGDIKSIVRLGGDVDVSGWPVGEKAVALMESIRVELASEGKQEDTP